MAKTTPKRIYRNTDDVKIAGVCSGIADYFDVDPTLIRLIWVLLCLWGGIGIVLYLIAWIIVPKNPDY